jgi:hypothetical protein
LLSCYNFIRVLSSVIPVLSPLLAALTKSLKDLSAELWFFNPEYNQVITSSTSSLLA